MREIVNAILYQGRTGVQWDYLPHDLPPGSATYYFAKWRGKGQKGINSRNALSVAAGKRQLGLAGDQRRVGRGAGVGQEEVLEHVRQP